MRIGIDARFYGSLGKGLGRYTAKLIERLEEIDRENDYVVFLSPENFAEYEPRNPRFTKVLSKSRWYSFAEQLFFPFLLFQRRLDLMHFPHFNVPLLYRRPFVVTVHDLILFHYPTLRATTRSAALYALKFLAYRLVISSAIRRSRHIIAVSRFTGQDIEQHYPAARKKLSVILEGIDPFCLVLQPEEERALFSRLGLSAPDQEGTNSRDIIRPYILYVGNAYPHKNLEAFLDIAPSFPDHRFLLVGKEDYFYARLKEEAEKRAIGNVQFAGFLTDRELGSVYRHAKAYAFPSLYEGFGLPPLEAMTYGVPVASSSRGSLPEILGNAACYFDPEDPESFREALRTLLAEGRASERLREAGYERLRNFDWNVMAEQTRRLYLSGR